MTVDPLSGRWSDDSIALLLNPRMPAAERERLERLAAAAPPLRGHVWMATSGSTGSLKLTALSKEALLASAAAVNQHLEVQRGEAWCCVLPTFHVGGLGIYARAMLSGGQVVGAEWEPRSFVKVCESEGVALSALVPAQVSDLVREGLRVPRSMRAIVVGGGALRPDLLRAGRELGWPLLPSYGMTECCSQIATALGPEPELILLPHLSARTEPDGRLAFSGSSLLSGYALEIEGQPAFIDPKVDGWFVSEDLGQIDGRVLRVSGRTGELIKIGGESVDLARLDRVLAEVASGADAALLAAPEVRLGHVIHLAVARGDANALQAAYDARVLPFERIRAIHAVPAIPRSPLGKLLRGALWSLVSDSPKTRE